MRADNFEKRFSIGRDDNYNGGFRRKDDGEILVRGPTKIWFKRFYSLYAIQYNISNSP